MHRSGTSAFAGAIARLGAAGPATPMPPLPENPRGFGESQVVATLNGGLLAEAGSAWDDWRRLDVAPAPEPTSRIVAVLRAEFADAPAFVLKDPRLCRLLPMWLPAIAEVGAAPIAVLAFRRPAEVAASLAARNGQTPVRALLLWLRHVLDAERASRAMPRIGLSYERLLHEGRAGLLQLACVLGLTPQDDGAAAADFLSAALRRERPPEAVPHVGSALAEGWAARALALMRSFERDGESDALAEKFDVLAAAFDDASGLFAAAAPFPRPRRLLELPEVTLCAVEAREGRVAARALNAAATQLRGGDALLVSPERQGGAFRHERVPLATEDAAAAFRVGGLAERLRTRFAMMLPWDGRVRDVGLWSPAFLDCDYVPARWTNAPDAPPPPGGFSLRSARLLGALRDGGFVPPPATSDDAMIRGPWRPALEAAGLRFAPDGLAAAFAAGEPPGLDPTFGFQGLAEFWRHVDDAEMIGIVHDLDEATLLGAAFARCVMTFLLLDRDLPLRAMAERWRAATDDAAIAASLLRESGQAALAQQGVARLAALSGGE